MNQKGGTVSPRANDGGKGKDVGDAEKESEVVKEYVGEFGNNLLESMAASVPFVECGVCGVTEKEEGAEEEAGERMKAMRRMQDPMLPSEAEVEMHRMTHLPYRSWCKFCVAGRGKEDGHRRQEEREDGVAELHLDYCFPKTCTGERSDNVGDEGKENEDVTCDYRAQKRYTGWLCGEKGGGIFERNWFGRK